MEQAFKEIYEKNIWGGGSGSGSNMSNHNKKYINDVQDIITKYNIKTICDIGCGDWVFSQYIDFSGCEYVGVDCVESVITDNKRDFEKNNITFEHHAIGEDYIPEGYDLVLIKDVIQHWTDEDIIKYFGDVLHKNTYVYATNGYKFMRDPKKSALTKRDISNKYRYHPVSIDKYPLSDFKDYCLSTDTYHAKQMNLFRVE